MKFYISTTGIKRVTGSGSGGKVSTVAASRPVPSRAVLPVLLVLAIVLPFLFVRIAFLVLESATACNSSIDCMGWSILGGSESSDTSMYVKKLREELRRAVLEAREGGTNDDGMGDPIESFNELVKDMTSKRLDINTFAFRTKATVLLYSNYSLHYLLVCIFCLLLLLIVLPIFMVYFCSCHYNDCCIFLVLVGIYIIQFNT